MVSKSSSPRHRGGAVAAKSAEKLVKSRKKQKHKSYRDIAQVRLDVERVPENRAAKVNIEKRIARVLTMSPHIHYYQGFHDVARFAESDSQLETVALEQLRDFMASTLGPTLDVLRLVPELLARADPEGVGASFVRLETEPAHLALAPVITLFSHDCDDPELLSVIIRRVAEHGLSYALYLFAAVCITFKSTFVDIEDTDELHSAISKVAGLLDRSNFSKIALLAGDLHTSFPLQRLEGWRHISPYSVLRTGRVRNHKRAIGALVKLDRAYNRKGLLKSIQQPPTGIVHLVLAASVVALGLFWTRTKSN